MSEGNLFETLSGTEINNIRSHMEQLDPAHTLDANMLLKFASAQCDNNLSNEQSEEIQTNLEVSQGERFADEYGLDKNEVNTDYTEIER